MTEPLCKPRYKRRPKYQVLPSTQTPIVEEGQIVGWTLRMTMMHQGILHTEEMTYTCAPDEVRPFPCDGQALEDVLAKAINELDLMQICEAGLEAKIPSTEE